MHIVGNFLYLLSTNTTSKTSNSTGPNIKKSIFFFYLKKFKTSFWIELSSKHLFFYMLIFLPPTLKPLDHFLIDKNILSLTYYFVHKMDAYCTENWMLIFLWTEFKKYLISIQFTFNCEQNHFPNALHFENTILLSKNLNLTLAIIFTGKSFLSM